MRRLLRLGPALRATQMDATDEGGKEGRKFPSWLVLKLKWHPGCALSRPGRRSRLWIAIRHSGHQLG